jgi:hypothetical protein
MDRGGDEVLPRAASGLGDAVTAAVRALAADERDDWGRTPGEVFDDRPVPEHTDDDAPPDIEPSKASWDRMPERLELPAPDFPAELLGDEFLYQFATNLAAAFQVPVDLPAMQMLGALATALGPRVVLRVKKDWAESVCLYLLPVADSGERKSPIETAVWTPLYEFEGEERKRREPARRKALQRLELLRKRLDAANTAAVRAADPLEVEVLELEAHRAQEALDIHVVPPRFGIFMQDATPEAIATRLCETGFVAAVSSEGGLMDNLAGRYSKSSEPNLDALLHGYNRGRIIIDRKSQGHLECPAAVVNLCLSVQPDVLRFCSNKPGFRARGMMARFLYALPRSRVGRRPVGQEAQVDPTLAAQWRSLLLEVAEKVGFVEDGETLELRLSDEARRLLVEYQKALEPRLDPDWGDLAGTGTWRGKLAGQLCRVAAVLHFGRFRAQALQHAVDGHSMGAALALSPYFEAHALRAFGEMDSTGTLALARDIARLLPRLGQRITRRDVHQRLKSRAGLLPEHLDRPLQHLAEAGWLKPLPEPTGRRGRAYAGPGVFAVHRCCTRTSLTKTGSGHR